MSGYAEYREVNLPWLKAVPAHWEMRRNKNIFTEQKEIVGERSADYTLLSLTLNGIIPRDMDGGGKFPESFDKYKIVKNGDMAFCLFDIDETPRTVGLSGYNGMLTGAYTIMRVSNINARFIYYYYLALDNGKMLRPLYTGLRKTININTFQSTKVPVPPREEQDQIVRFLDWKVSSINKLIRIRKRRIEELEAIKRSSIGYLVMGQTQSIPQRGTAISWVKTIPAHWNEKSLIQVAEEQQMKTVEDDPMFDKKRAQKKLRSFVESDSYTIAKKAAMMVDHFHEQVIAKGKIGGQARAMVVTSSIPRCIEYYYTINKCLADRRSPYKTIIAFSGENKFQGQEPPLTSAGLNGFPDAKIPKEFKKDPYRILIVADMFQTGFDEPLLHTMYVDKMLYDIKAVQTLSRLNRCCPKKYDTFVLDFANKPEIIQESFSRYYRTTILSGETDPNKLYDLVATMEEYQVFSNEDVERLVNLYLDGADRDKLDPTLDACTAVYKQLDTDDQIKFKSAAKAFVRTYGFLGAILPYGNADWERLSIFLNLLIPKLPSPREDDLSQGILETIDLESYRNEAREVMSIRLEDADTEVAPVPAGKVGHIVEPEMDLLSVILSNFNDMFGNINWNDADNVRRQILEIPAMVSKDEKYQNAMKNSDEQSARLESERALQQVIFSIMADNMELFKQFQDNPSFKKWLSDLVFNLTYNKDGKPYEIPVQNRKN